MESLYTKYRPKTFSDVVGQQHVVATLMRAVVEQSVSHAYLFCGPRGTGKTTMARILAKALLCHEGAGRLPDGTCDECLLVAQGNHPDVIEIDAASNTGVDNVREAIIGRVNFAPTRGNWKVYIVDEVHMLTTQAFNALLKTLEEPPSGVVFVLCTTDPQRIPATILSRVQRFDFHAIAAADMRAHLDYVCESEGFSAEDEALDLVVRQAHGGMRDALTSLEQLATMTGGTITLGAVRDLFGETSDATLSTISMALATRNVTTLFEQVAGLVDAGRDLLQFTRELAAHLRDVYVVSALGTTEGVVSATGEELVRLSSEAQAFGSVDRVARALTVLGDAASEMRTAPNQQLVLEIAFTRIARPQADMTLEALAERVAVLEARLALGVPPMAPPSTVQPPVSAPVAPVPPEPKPQPKPEPEPEPEPEPQPAQQAPIPPVQQQAPQPQANVDMGALQRAWRGVVDGVMAVAPSRGSLLLNSTPASDEGDTIRVSLPAGSAFALRMLERPDVREVVNEQFARIFGTRRLVFFEAGKTSVASVPAPVQSPVQAAEAASAPVPVPVVESVPVQAPAPVSDAASVSTRQMLDAVTIVIEDDEPLPWNETPESEAPPAPNPEPEPAPAPVPAPVPEPEPEPEPAPASEPSVETVTMDDLPPEFASVMKLVSDAFGAPVDYIVEPASPTPDDLADYGNDE